MKTDRILGIIIYLLNHDHVPASRLAERFQVSVRTIQRDIVTISETGIPIYADAGKNGGYSILPNYKLNNAEIRKEEQQLVVKALESLATSYTSDTLKQLLEKYNAMVEKEGGQKVFWDFSVTKENQLVQDRNGMLEDAAVKLWQQGNGGGAAGLPAGTDRNRGKIPVQLRHPVVVVSLV